MGNAQEGSDSRLARWLSGKRYLSHKPGDVSSSLGTNLNIKEHLEPCHSCLKSLVLTPDKDTTEKNSKSISLVNIDTRFFNKIHTE